MLSALTIRRMCIVASAFWFLSNASASAVLAGQTPTRLTLQPVGASSNHLISGNGITVPPGGARVTLELRFEGWDSDGDGVPQIKTIQAQIDSTGYSSGATGMLSPVVEPCAGTSECEAVLGLGAICGTPTAGECSPAFQNGDHPRWIFLGQNAIRAINFFTPDFIFGATTVLGSGTSDDGQPRYFGTLVLDVSPDATGTFTLGFKTPSTDAFWEDTDGFLHPPDEVVSALITIGPVDPPCCLPDGSCAHLADAACVAAGGARGLGTCTPDSNGNSIADSCEGVIAPCCHPNGPCDYRSELACAGLGGSFGAPVCSSDGNENGVADSCEADCDGDTIPDIDEVNVGERDCDLDGICNAVEISDCVNNPSPACADCQSNGVPDGCEADCNGNGIADECELSSGSATDCNGNGVPDDCDDDCAQDCNGNGSPDCCDVQPGGGSVDCQPNGVPDECEIGACCFDSDNDGVFELCSLLTEPGCLGVSGVFRGPCRECPTQNILFFVEGDGSLFAHVVGSPIDCRDEPIASRQGCTPGAQKIDPWRSPSDGQMCYNFGAPGRNLPMDFFGPGSDSFSLPVCMEGAPLGIVGFGDADTLIARSADPFDRCDLPSLTQVTVDVSVSELSLASVSPITVTFNGGQNPEQWNVTVDLSSVAPPMGSLTAEKTHCNGGTYTSSLNVMPRFTFTKVGDPGSVVVLDTGLEGFAHVVLEQSELNAWVHDPDPALGLLVDPCTAFHPGVEDANKNFDCDCNGNLLRDDCDIENGISADCNANAIPDQCDIDSFLSEDCTGNGVPDECEPDCNANATADGCDILNAFSLDENTNVVPDECERLVTAPIAETTILKSRYVSFRPGSATGGGAMGIVQAFRVTSPDFPGLFKWVGPPDANNVSRLQCTPHYRDWGFAMVHIGDRDIIPGKSYVVEGIAEGSDTTDAVPYSDPPTGALTHPTFADLTGTPTVNFADISFAVRVFQGAEGFAGILVADVAPEIPNTKVNFTDISVVVNVFKGSAYPFGDPLQCP